MRWLGIELAVWGGVAAAVNLAVSSDRAAFPISVWVAVCIVGIIIVATHPTQGKKVG